MEAHNISNLYTNIYIIIYKNIHITKNGVCVCMNGIYVILSGFC